MVHRPARDVVERAVQLAGRVPSLHNSQPWHWIFDGTALQLFAQPARLLPATDSSGRQLLLSCGIVLLGHDSGTPRWPQVLIRVGTPRESDTPPAPTPRRPLTEILDITSDLSVGKRAQPGYPKERRK